MERLQKVLAEAGLGSRRRCEELILAGHISINGQVVKTLGVQIDPKIDKIKFDGKEIKSERKVYLLLNKPKGYVTTLSDPQGRPTIVSLLKGVRERVYPVGRLDYDSQGLLFLTNDGDLANKLIHPKLKIAKTYLVKLKGKLEASDIMRLRKGIRIEGGSKTLPADVRVTKNLPKNTLLKMTITEGKKRQIRRMGEAIKHEVLSLKRIQFGPFHLSNLKLGEYVYLNPDEVKKELKRFFL
ncbi:MAG: pseudouridine synthase [bacterium]|nr:pseudouridine synthase [bacterium]